MIALSNIYATIIAFYLSKYDKIAIKRLECHSFSEAFTKCAKLTGAKESYIRLRRDEFDPVYKWRKGWHNRSMHKIVCRTIELFEELSESDTYILVKDILDHNMTKELDLIVSFMQDIENDSHSTSYATRVMTGNMAELCFKEYHAKNGLPFPGLLEDCTADGCGYDFRIHTDSNFICIEVKGIIEEHGSILLTEKEWKTAMVCGDRYYLCIVRNIYSTPQFQFIRDPYRTLDVLKKTIQITQTTYSITNEELMKNIY